MTDTASDRLVAYAHIKRTPHDAARVLARTVGALAEHDAYEQARELVAECRKVVHDITPRSSQAYALGALAKASAWLGRDITRSVINQLAETQRQDDYFRISLSLIDALAAIADDCEFITTIGNAMKEGRYREQVLSIARTGKRPALHPPRRSRKTRRRKVAYHCESNGGWCQLVYYCKSRRTEPLPSSWQREWCTAWDRCGVKSDTGIDWSRCEKRS